MVSGTWGVALIFISRLTCPFKNLAFENALLRGVAAPTLFLYVNDCAVVMGRAQNPWQEANLAFLKRENIPLIRRQSGGGTVVHDLGNLNFSFIAPPDQYDKNGHLELVLKALRSLNVEAFIGDHYALMVDGALKISGSAFRETRKGCFHHGTLLIDSDLAVLSEALRVPPRKIMSRSIPSRRSPVMNVRTLNPELSIERVQNALISCFSAHHDYDPTAVQWVEDSHFESEAIREDMKLYQSHAWTYEHCLPFSETLMIEGLEVTLQIEGGKIVACEPFWPGFSLLKGMDYLSFDDLREI